MVKVKGETFRLRQSTYGNFKAFVSTEDGEELWTSIPRGYTTEKYCSPANRYAKQEAQNDMIDMIMSDNEIYYYEII